MFLTEKEVVRFGLFENEIELGVQQLESVFIDLIVWVLKVEDFVDFLESFRQTLRRVLIHDQMLDPNPDPPAAAQRKLLRVLVAFGLSLLLADLHYRTLQMGHFLIETLYL